VRKRGEACAASSSYGRFGDELAMLFPPNRLCADCGGGDEGLKRVDMWKGEACRKTARTKYCML